VSARQTDPVTATSSRCPCGSGDVYGDCCGRFHAGGRAPTAEALMRSRYTAFVLRDEAHLLASWAPEGRPAALDLDDDLEWLRLDVLRRTGGGPFDDTGTVEFEARYRRQGQRGVQREDSRFERCDGAWLYVGPVGPGPV